MPDEAAVDPRARLIIALDVASVAAAEAVVDRIGEAGHHYKIGYELGFSGGLDVARALVGAGKLVFLDFKLHDIANTVERGVAALARLGAHLVTVHAYGQTLRAAVAGAAGSQTKILAVTVLTSWTNADVSDEGYTLALPDLVDRRARLAMAAGAHGLVMAATEAHAARTLLGPGPLIVTPGIRPAGAAPDDQRRVMTPADAIRAGASHIVVGRPIVAAPDPAAAAGAVLDEIRAALPSAQA